jgi:hypothetical protein
MITARAHGRTAARRHPAPARRAARPPETIERPAATPRSLPPVAGVHRRADTRLYHTRCGRAIELVNVRGGVEFDFRCVSCWEHVTLTESALMRVPSVNGNGNGVPTT